MVPIVPETWKASNTIYVSGITAHTIGACIGCQVVQLHCRQPLPPSWSRVKVAFTTMLHLLHEEVAASEAALAGGTPSTRGTSIYTGGIEELSKANDPEKVNS